MKTVLMFGWEYPPHSIGGLGVACKGLVNALIQKELKVILVLPFMPEVSQNDQKKIISYTVNDSLIIKKIPSSLIPYATASSYKRQQPYSSFTMYGQSIFQEVERFSHLARLIAAQEKFDVIHVHDWMTIPAGIAAKEVSGKPLIVHVHSTEFDRTGGYAVHPDVYAIERKGLVQADKVVAVSAFTKNKILSHYPIDSRKIRVVYNGINIKKQNTMQRRQKNELIVLFLGRVTLQKGPDHFILIAKKVLQHHARVIFVIAGSGDMYHMLIEKIAREGLTDKIIFTGFLNRDEVQKAFSMTDVYVMPSVSEPFGLSALEAIEQKVPVVISKQSGVQEVVNHGFKIDFWDVNKAAHYILALLEYPLLRNEMAKNALRKIATFSWDRAATQCLNLYNEI